MKIKETKTIADCQNVFTRHQPEKGDSWKRVGKHYLRASLNNEIWEWRSAAQRHDVDKDVDQDDGQEYKELLDVINVATMLAERLRED